MDDLFEAADFNEAMNGSASSQMMWCAISNMPKYNLVRDKKGNEFLIVTGTEFVIIIEGNSNCTMKYTVWKGGLMGVPISSTSSLDGALMVVKKEIPPHIIAKYQKLSGYVSGYRTKL